MNIFVLYEFVRRKHSSSYELHTFCAKLFVLFFLKIVFVQNDHFKIRCYYRFSYLLFASAKFIERQKRNSGI